IRQYEVQMAVRLRHCCCGCSLKEGTIVIGVYFILMGLTSMAGSIYGVVYFVLHYNDKDYKYVGPEVILPTTVVGLVLALTEVITSSLLLRGVVKYDRRLIIPWLVHNALMCGIVFLGVVGGAITCFIVTATHIRGDLTTATYGYIILIPGAVVVGVYVYFLLVVYSFYSLLPMFSSERIAILLNRFKNPYISHENESDHTTTTTTTTDYWGNATATPRFSGY
ncbi:hypothetical protein L9F63_001321, partial [Diploptera punctata]